MRPFRSRRQAIIVLGASVVTIALAMLLLERALEAALRIPVDAYLRARTLGIAHTDSSSGLKIGLPRLRLSLFRRRLDLYDVRIRYDQQSESGLLHFEADAPAIRLTGLDLSDVVWRRSLRLSGVRIERPVLRRRREAPPDSAPARPEREPDDTLPVTLPAPDSLLFSLVAAWLPDEVRGARIERVLVTDATVHSEGWRGTAVTRDSTAGLTLELRGLELDTTGHRVFERGTLRAASFVHSTEQPGDSLLAGTVAVTVAPDDTTIDVGEFRTGATPDGHQLRVHGVRRSHARQTLTVDSVTYAPAGPDSSFFRAAPPRATRVRLRAKALQASGLRQEQIRHRQIIAGGIWIGEAALDVLADRRAPPGPDRTRRLWPTRLAALPWGVAVDSIVLTSGTIRYAELLPGRPRAGAAEFARVHARMYGVSNDSADAGTPARIVAAARLYGQGALSTQIEVPIRTGPIRIAARGELGPMPLTSFNEFLLPANGIEVTGGQVEAVAFHFSVAGGKARGEFGAAWQEFGLKLVDPVTGRQSLGKKLKSMVAGAMVRGRQGRNDKGGLRTVKIDYDQQPGDTFWGLLWRAVRSGMVKAVKN